MTISVHDKQFRPFISSEEIAREVQRIAKEISRDLRDKDPLFCPTLTGAYMFMADLAKAMDFDAETYFVKYTSYSGMSSTGIVRAELPFPAKCSGRHVVIVEDIVDSGTTMKAMLDALVPLKPAGVYIATFLFKPDSFRETFPIDYVGKRIGNDFILGYGLDYDGRGRCYPDIYVVNQ